MRYSKLLLFFTALGVSLFLASCSPSPRYSTLEAGSTSKSFSSKSKSSKSSSSKTKANSKKTKDLSKKFHSVGVASWYGPGFQGKLTANGEKFNMRDLTAAHLTLAFNTKVEVTNLDNGRKVVVRINDRGPYHKGRDYMKDRIIDLSKKAATKLGFVDKGTANVKLRILK